MAMRHSSALMKVLIGLRNLGLTTLSYSFDNSEVQEKMSNIKVETHGLCSLITINRPERRNAICRNTALDLQQAFVYFDASPQRVAILTGEGDEAFCAGADLKSISPGPAVYWKCIPGIGFTTDKPIIAATAGWAIGVGMVLAMYCDLIVADETTVFSYPEGKIGRTGGLIAGAVARIPQKVALDLMLLGRPMGAHRAYQVGLVNDVTKKGEHISVAMAHAETMIATAPLVIKTLKRFSSELIPKSSAERMLAASSLVNEMSDSNDFKEGVAAFKERRTPRFTGR